MKLTLNKNKFLFFLTLCSIIQCSWAQFQPYFSQLNKANGLSNNRVNCFAEDTYGFIWIGTKNGLNRYDGKNIKVYDASNSNFVSNDIIDILIDNEGSMWVATLDGGLFMYNQAKDSFLPYSLVPHNNEPLYYSKRLYKLFEDSNGNLWAGTDNAVYKLNKKEGTLRFFEFNHVRSFKNITVTSFSEALPGYLWVGTFGGGLKLLNIETGEYKSIEANNQKFKISLIHCILKLKEDVLLIGTKGNGLVTLNTKTYKLSNFLENKWKKHIKIKIVRSIISDKNNDLWIGTDGNGILHIKKFNEKGYKIINYYKKGQAQHSLAGNAINEVMKDSHSNIWVGTTWNGISILKEGSKFGIVYSDIKGKDPTGVLSIFKTQDKLFLGSDGNGMTSYNYKTSEVKYYFEEHNKPLKIDYIQQIVQTKNGSLWLGTFTDGLLHCNENCKLIKQFKHDPANPESISYNDIRHIIEDENNNLWIATWGGGLNFFETKTQKFKQIRELNKSSSLSSTNNITSMYKDKNNIWMATFGGGLWVYNISSDKFTNYLFDDKNKKSISANNLYSVYKDSKGYIWIGTAGAGINRLNPKTKEFQRFRDHDIYSHNSVVGIIEDNQGRIWFSSQEGVIYYDYNEDIFKKFPYLIEEFHINSVFNDNSGFLYFGSVEGAIRINTKTFDYTIEQPKIRLINLKVFNKDIPILEKGILQKSIILQDKIVLEHDQNVLSLQYAALQFPSAVNREFSIRLLNFDKEWRDVGKNTETTYTNLNPGSYTFIVRSRESNMEWGKEYKLLEIKVLKPLWLRWWALILYGIVFLFLLYMFRKYIIAWEQMKSNLEIEKVTHEKDIELYNIKQQFFTNISHEIRTPITLILSSISKLMKAKEFKEQTNKNPINTLKKNGQILLNLINELLDFRKLESKDIKLRVTQENWVDFCKEIFLSFKELASQKQMDFTFRAPSDKIQLWFDRNQMDKVLYNLLSNAFKFTKASGSIEISLSETDDNATVMIHDKGVGISKRQLSKVFSRYYQVENKNFNSSANGFGLGLSISNEIVAKHHGNILVDSKKDKGTTFTVILKKGSSHFKKNELVGNETSAEVIENYFINYGKELKAETSEILGAKEQTLLIIEDNEDIRSYLVELLSDEFTVFQAGNGKEGLAIVNKYMPDMIISDIMMPIMDGIEFTEKIKSDIRTNHIPVILLTARNAIAYKIEGYRQGADDYIVKPFNESLLRVKIKNLLRNRELIQKRFSTDSIILPGELNINKTEEDFLMKFISTIQNNLDSNFLADYIISEMGMSHSVVYKKIKALTGMNIVEFVRDHKLKIAKVLIEEEQYSVADACYKIGYSDRKYFSKLFKKRFGKNPSDFLKKK